MTKNAKEMYTDAPKIFVVFFYDDIVIIAPNADFWAYSSSILLFLVFVVVVGVMIR